MSSVAPQISVVKPKCSNAEGSLCPASFLFLSALWPQGLQSGETAHILSWQGKIYMQPPRASSHARVHWVRQRVDKHTRSIWRQREIREKKTNSYIKHAKTNVPYCKIGLFFKPVLLGDRRIDTKNKNLIQLKPGWCHNCVFISH